VRCDSLPAESLRGVRFQRLQNLRRELNYIACAKREHQIVWLRGRRRQLSRLGE